MNSIKSLEKEIEQYRNKKDVWEKKQYKGGKQGYSSNDIIYFCDYHKIKCFGYDWKMNQFITNKDKSIKFNMDACFCVLFQ